MRWWGKVAGKNMAESFTVKTAVAESEEFIFACSSDEQSVASQTCKMCLREIAKYSCPRCNQGYCSLPCYQSEKHAACSEAFYKDCVISELKDMTNLPQDREKVLKMLSEDLEQRAQEESDEETQDEDLEDRLQGLDIDKDIQVVWSRLTQNEKEDFARMLQDGRLARLIEIWTPWWQCKENFSLVQEKQMGTTHQGGRDVPDIFSDIPDINMLLKNTCPSSDCRFDLINILFSYCFVARIHNGCHLECPIDSTQDLLDVCAVLRDQYKCGSIGEAIQKALDDVSRKGKSSEDFSYKFNLSILEDVRVIICGPGSVHSMTFMSAALSDLVRLLREALNVVKKELKNQVPHENRDVAELKTLKTQVFKSEKKIMFMLSWLQRYGSAAHQAVPLLQFEIETRQSEAGEISDIKMAVETNMDKLNPAVLHCEDQVQRGKITELD